MHAFLFIGSIIARTRFVSFRLCDLKHKIITFSIWIKTSKNRSKNKLKLLDEAFFPAPISVSSSPYPSLSLFLHPLSTMPMKIAIIAFGIETISWPLHLRFVCNWCRTFGFFYVGLSKLNIKLHAISVIILLSRAFWIAWVFYGLQFEMFWHNGDCSSPTRNKQ